MGRLEEAILQYQEALRLQPNLAEAEFNLAAAFDQQGKIDEALPHFQNAVKLRPHFPEASTYFARLVPAASQSQNLNAMLTQYVEARRQSQQTLIAPGEAMSFDELQARLKAASP
jgi:tetratricopeptide (TPR) repeat protein